MKVFYDKTGKRWKIVKIVTEIIVGVWVLISFAYLITIIIGPSLNDLPLFQENLSSAPPDESKSNEIILAAQRDYQSLLNDSNNLLASGLNGPTSYEKRQSIFPVLLANSLNNSNNAYKSQTMAFFVGDENGLNSLKENINNIDVLLPLWLSLDGKNLSLKFATPESVKMVEDVKAGANSDLKVMPVISNYDAAIGDWNGISIQRLLNNVDVQNILIEQLKNYAVENKLYGISLDFENITQADMDKYFQFVSKTKEVFSQNKLILSINIPINSRDYDFKKFAGVSDFIIIRAYDEHWLTSEPGPIASQKWFQEKLFDITSKIPKEKLVIGLGTFGYDWTDGVQTANTISYSQAIQLARDSGAQIVFNNANLNTNFEYFDKDNKRHQVYLFDAISAFNEKQYAANFQPKGYAIWRLGFEDSSVWSVLKEDVLMKQIAGIEKILAFKAIDYQGDGDVLKVKSIPQTGARKVTYDEKLNLITKVDYNQLPSGYVISKTGKATDKAVTLTFDDGPDPVYTPQILDILKKYDVKATFFVVGSEAAKNSKLLKRILNEGHLIASHTYNHPDISKISNNKLNSELNTTQLLIESILNIKTMIFRPPYDVDINPKTIEQARPLNKVSEAGYLSVGFGIDSKDWEMPGVEKMVKETVAQTEEKQGGIILFHDAGGDRSETIAALPKIIEELKTKGFHFVPLNEMIGVEAEAINSPVNGEDLMTVVVNKIFTYSLRFFMYFLQIMIIIGLIIGLFRFIPIAVMALIQAKESRHKHFDENFNPKVSVIIAAYNEEKVIKETIDNILLADYDKEKLEIIIVNDGSTDKTWKVLKKHFGKHPNVRIFNKENGGKSNAVNYGVMRANGEIMVSIDADTLIDPQTIKLLVRHFNDPKIGAVAGNAKVGNRENVITKFQALEYITSQNLDKRAFDMLNAITVVPGAIGAWRMDLVKKLGGLDNTTLAEDSDLTLHIIEDGYVVHFEENGLAYTEAPVTLKDLAAQRFRWAFGTLQVLMKNKTVIGNPKFKWLGIVGLPNVLLFQVFFPLITPIVDLALILQVLIYLTQIIFHLNVVTFQQFANLFFYSVIFNIMDISSCLLAFSLEKRENWKLLFLMLPQRIFYRFFLNWICIKSLISAAKGNAIGWNKLEREGHLKSETIGQGLNSV